MSIGNLSVHQTTTNRIWDAEGVCWEFVCLTCGYQARYVAQPTNGSQQFEILSVGDPQARHTGNHVHVTPTVSWPEPAPDGDESWLTPELRRQMEELLRDIDMGHDEE